MVTDVNNVGPGAPVGEQFPRHWQLCNGFCTPLGEGELQVRYITKKTTSGRPCFCWTSGTMCFVVEFCTFLVGVCHRLMSGAFVDSVHVRSPGFLLLKSS